MPKGHFFPLQLETLGPRRGKAHIHGQSAFHGPSHGQPGSEDSERCGGWRESPGGLGPLTSWSRPERGAGKRFSAAPPLPGYSGCAIGHVLGHSEHLTPSRTRAFLCFCISSRCRLHQLPSLKHTHAHTHSLSLP